MTRYTLTVQRKPVFDNKVRLDSTLLKVYDSKLGGQVYDLCRLQCNDIHVRCCVDLGTRLISTSSGVFCLFLL